METLLRAGFSNAVAATLMALLVACLSRPLARRPAIRHGLWVLVLVKLITPPIYEIPIPWRLASPAPVRIPQEIAVPVADPPAEVVVRGNGPAHGLESMDAPVEIMAICEDRLVTMAPLPAGSTVEPPRFLAAALQQSRWIGAAWLGGSAVVLLLSLRRIHRFQKALTMARGASWLEQEWVVDWAKRIGLRRAPDVWWVPGRISPMVWCLGLRPRLILPEEFWKRLDAQQRSTLIAHELAHLKRGDHLVRLLELLVTALFWWHPVVWWMRAPLREAEEQCCDAWVVWALPDAVRAYAETLLDTLEFLQQSSRSEPLLASGLGRVPDLRRRLTMVMTGTSRRLPGLPGRLGLLIAAGIMLPVGATWAQKADETKAVRIEVRSLDGKLLTEDVKAVDADNIAPAEVLLTGDVLALQSPRESRAVVLRLDSQDNLGDKVELSGPLDEVTKKLAVLIAESKKGGSPKDSAKQRTAALEQALEALKKAGTLDDNTVHLRLHDDDKTVHVRLLNDVAHLVRDQKKDGPGGDRSEEVARTRKEIAKLKVDLKTTMAQLDKAQARLRELGEDPGEIPSLGWRRNAQIARTYTVVRDDKKTAPRTERQKTFAVIRPDNAVTIPTDRQRMEKLEKAIKALQDEVEHLKRGSAQDEVKK
jgi:beta-lactamase regulating signal transducer with metallopeptidase domain